jgi:hypothetical protein
MATVNIVWKVQPNSPEPLTRLLAAIVNRLAGDEARRR